jgi:malate dehydrogenase (oxaloacetate-decarboxylating)
VQQIVIPILAGTATTRQTAGGPRTTNARGLAVLHSPPLNKGMAFTAEERKALGLTGLLPPDITTLKGQVKRAWGQYERLNDSLTRNIFLTTLHDRNEVLFYRLFSEHMREMIPIVNDLSVGVAMEKYQHECWPDRGVYLSIDHADAIEEAFTNLRTSRGDIDLILATDAERIPGVGDWGVRGLEASIGKAAIYTAAGGIDPGRVVPVMLDAGTAPGTRAFGEPAMTRSLTHMSRLPGSSSPTRCCNGTGSLPPTAGASWSATRTTPAPSMRICRAPEQSPWPRPSQPCGSAGLGCAASVW